MSRGTPAVALKESFETVNRHYNEDASLAVQNELRIPTDRYMQKEARISERRRGNRVEVRSSEDTSRTMQNEKSIPVPTQGYKTPMRKKKYKNEDSTKLRKMRMGNCKCSNMKKRG